MRLWTAPHRDHRPRRRQRGRSIAALVPAILSFACWGCADEALLSGVDISPSAITPDQDGVEDVARITYSVGRPAAVSIVFSGPDGSSERFVFRESKPREPGTGYQALFGGVIDGRMLPNGRYDVAVEAVPLDGGGAPVSERTELTIRNADAVAPTLEGFTVHPPRFSPNQDGINDRVSISYRLEEPADIRIWLETAAGDYVGDILADVQTADRPGEPGPHVIDYDAGVDADAPPPVDGEYVVVAVAKDVAGNVSEHRAPLTIENGGLPSVALVGDVAWSQTLIPLGATIHFTATVLNAGDTPVRTRGPEPGTIYDSDRSYNMAAPPEWLIVARSGDVRSAVRLPFDAIPAIVDFGAEASQRITVADPSAPALCVRLDPAAGTSDPSTRPVDVYVFESDGDAGRRLEADGAGDHCLATLDETPTIRRAFAQSPGSIRLGVAFDMLESSLDYPFRWQLGTIDDLEICDAETGAYLCLPPEREVRISGGIRFVAAPYGRSGNAHLSILHEDVSRMHGPYGVRRVTIDFDEPNSR